MSADVENNLPLKLVGKLPSTSPWSTGLFACFEDQDICWEGYTCPCVLYGKVAAVVNPTEDHTDDKGKGFCLSHFFLGGCYATPLSWCCGPAAFWCTCAPCLGARHRTHLRSLHGIAGGPMNDFCTHFCCHQCALCQEARQIKHGQPLEIHPTQRSRLTPTNDALAEDASSSGQLPLSQVNAPPPDFSAAAARHASECLGATDSAPEEQKMEAEDSRNLP